MAKIDSLIVRVYTELNKSDQRFSTEDITCDPVQRRRFLEQLWGLDPEAKEAEALRRLTYLRKQKRLTTFQGAGSAEGSSTRSVSTTR